MHGASSDQPLSAVGGEQVANNTSSGSDSSSSSSSSSSESNDTGSEHAPVEDDFTACMTAFHLHCAKSGAKKGVYHSPAYDEGSEAPPLQLKHITRHRENGLTGAQDMKLSMQMKGTCVIVCENEVRLIRLCIRKATREVCIEVKNVQSTSEEDPVCPWNATALEDVADQNAAVTVMAWCAVILGLNHTTFDSKSRLGVAVKALLLEDGEVMKPAAAAKNKKKGGAAPSPKKGVVATLDMKFRNSAERKHAMEIERILRGNNVKALKACIVQLCHDLEDKKRSCDDKAKLLATMKKDQMELEALNAKSEWFKYEEERCIKRLRTGGQEEKAVATKDKASLKTKQPVTAATKKRGRGM